MKSTDKTTGKVKKPFLAKERGHTDVSLTAERGKTDDSLFDLRQKTERETDATVKNDRKVADKKRDQNRTARDETSVADARLVNQRLADDKTVQTERSKVDKAIQQERAQKEAVLSEFLLREREETDVNLSHERKQTDDVVESSSKLLDNEVGLHSKTKAELTTRDELLAIVSHDLKSPIGSVLTCADMLLTDPEFSQMGSELTNWIQLIKRNAQTSLKLIRDLLDMERIAEGKLELHPSGQNLTKVVREAIDPFVPLASTNRILLRVIPSDTDVFAFFDRERLAQVLSNLIGNALKFTPEGGSVVLSIDQTDDETVVAVRDTGIGISDEDKLRIFNRYAQIGKKDRTGIGLGLYISKMLIESHGGRLWVISAPDKGSIFNFSLPNK